MRDHTRWQLHRYVLLILILKDVFLLGSIGCHVLLAELLAVRIKAVVHGANKRQAGRCINTIGNSNRCNIVLLDGSDIFTDSVNIIHLLVGNVKKKLRTQRRFRRIHAECGENHELWIYSVEDFLKSKIILLRFE